MFKINVYSIGKTKEEWLSQALALYQQRLIKNTKLHYIWAKDNDQLLKWLEKENGVFLLDSKGNEFSSEGFSKFLFQELEKFGSSLSFVIGGYDGFPESFSQFPTISLSKFTFTHQMARLILTEQIYRANEISRNSPYHFS